LPPFWQIDRDDHPRDHAFDSLRLRDYPFDIFGKSIGWGSTSKNLDMSLRIFLEQLRGARMAMAMALFYIYLGIFTTVALSSNKGEVLFEHNEALRRMVTERELPFKDAHIEKNLPDMYTLSDFWLYMQGPFVDNFLPRYEDTVSWPGDADRLPSPRFSRNMHFVGPLRLRQLRVRSDACVVPRAAWLKRGEERSSRVVTDEDKERYDLHFSEVAALPWPGTPASLPPRFCRRHSVIL
jgi:hypothetical protein